MIIIVWILSATISIPPIIATMLGSEALKNFNDLQQCELSRNKVYVIYSACGSFYIPALIMTAVYAQVFIETKKRFRERAKGLPIDLKMIFIWVFFILAAAKLANATRGHKNLPVNSQSISQDQKLSLASSIIHPTNSSLKYSASNGSGVENFSTDDAEETFASRIEPSKSLTNTNLITTNRFNHCRKSDMNTSQMSFSISVDENKRLSISK